MFLVPPADAAAQLLLNQQWRSAALDVLLPLFSSRLLLLALLAAAIVWRSALRGKAQVAYFIVLALGMGVSDLGCNTIKHAVPRLRPEHSVVGTYYRDTGQWRRVPEGYRVDRERDTSFPSAHAANSMALAVLAVLFWPKTRRIMWALPVMVGWSRVYLGKHYPLDVVAGWIFGALVGWLVWLAWKRLAPRLKLAARPDDLFRPHLAPPGCR